MCLMLIPREHGLSQPLDLFQAAPILFANQVPRFREERLEFAVRHLRQGARAQCRATPGLQRLFLCLRNSDQIAGRADKIGQSSRSLIGKQNFLGPMAKQICSE